MLALYFGVPIEQAIGTSLIAVITTSAASSSVHLQRHTTDIRLGMTLELATALGAATTAYLVGYINRTALEVLFAAFLMYGAIMILRRGGKTEDEQDEFVPQAFGSWFYDSRLRTEEYAAWGWVLRWWREDLSGLLGIGGGPIKVPVMYIFMGIPLIVATATSNFMIGVTAAASASVYYRRGDVVVGIAAPMAVGVFVGSLLGARLAMRVHSKYVAILLVGIMLYLSLHMFVHIAGKFL